MPINFVPDKQAQARKDVLDVLDPIDFTPDKKINFVPAAAAKPLESKAGSFLGDLGASLNNRVTKPFKDTGSYIKENFQQGVQTMTHPEEVKVPSVKGAWSAAKLGTPMENVPDQPAPLLTQAKRPFGFIQAATAPLFAGTHGFISKPIEEATGGKIKADWVDLVRMFTPAGLGAATGAVRRVAGAVLPEKAENIVSAAVKADDKIITGKNHAEAYGKVGKEKDGSLIEGFTTDKGRFLSREEAAKLGKQTGQAPETTIEPGKLHSEDVAKAAGKPPETGVPQKEPGVLQKGSRALQSIFSPTTMSKDAGVAEGVVREQRGIAERATMQAQEQVNGISREINALPPEQQRDFVNYIETRSKGTKLANPKLQKAADTVRDVYQGVRAKLETSPATEKMGFVQDYFVHQWKDAKRAQAFVNDWVGKYGSGKSTQKRSLPTIEEGIKAGLVPLHDNPLDATMHYVGDMQNYLAMKAIQADLKEQGLRKFAPKGRQEPGWVELKGPGNTVVYAAEDEGKEKGLRAGLNVAYAPEDVARIYNRYYSPGFTGPTGDLYRGLRAVVNGPTQLLLGLSGYHYRLLANELSASAFGEGVGRLAKGDVAGAAKSAVKAMPYAGVLPQLQKGQALEQVYLGGKDLYGVDKQVVDYITRAGGRMTGIDKTLKASESNNFWEAWKKGTLKAEFTSGLKDIKDSGSIPAGAAKTFGFFATNVGRLMDTVAYPLFAKAVPQMKNAVNYDGVVDFLRTHPNASEEEILKATRDIVDSTDNRFGEMIQDNIFWDKKLKQALQLMVLSVGWDVGTAREMVGGTKDLSNFVAGTGELTPRAKYVIGAPIAHMLNASMYQYMKTGQAPQAPQDLVYPRTGGEVTESAGTKYAHKVPERLALPSQMKDVINYQEDPLQELQNKLAPVWKIAWQMANNADWRGDPISYQFEKQAPQGAKAYAEFVAKSLTPISLNTIASRKKGTAISPTEHILGSNPTGMRGADPVAFRAMKDNMEKAREKKGVQHLQREKANESSSN